MEYDLLPSLMRSCRLVHATQVANVNSTWVQELKQEVGFGAKDARRFFAAIPLVVVVNIASALCCNSVNNAFPSQACQMDLRVRGTQLDGAFFRIGDACAIVIFTPLFESCLYPLVARMKGSPVRLGQKIIAGLVTAAISNVAAAVLEFKRKDAPFLCGDAGFSQCAPGYAEDGSEGTRMKDISAFWIFIPFTLVGIAGMLVNPCMYCFSYEAAPLEVRSLLQAFNLFFAGSVSNAFTAVVSKLLYPNDLDTGSLDTYYFVNAFLAVIGIGVYFLITRCGHNGHDIRPAMQKELVVGALEEDEGSTDADAYQWRLQ